MLKRKGMFVMHKYSKLTSKRTVRIVAIASALITTFSASSYVNANASVINMLTLSSMSSMSSVSDISPTRHKSNTPSVPDAPSTPRVPNNSCTKSHNDRVNNIVKYTNIKRAQHGLAPVVVRPELSAIAQEWSDRMTREDHLYHRPQHWNAYPQHIPAGGENILQAWSNRSDEYLVQMWYESPGHKAIMLDPGAKSIGVGVSIAPNGKLYAVQNYGR